MPNESNMVISIAINAKRIQSNETLKMSDTSSQSPHEFIPVVWHPCCQGSHFKCHFSAVPNKIPLEQWVALKIQKTNSRSGMVASRQPFWTIIPTPTQTVAGLIFKYDRQNIEAMASIIWYLENGVQLVGYVSRLLGRGVFSWLTFIKFLALCWFQ